MEEILLQLQRTNDAFRWVLVGIWTTNAVAFLATLWLAMMVREVKREVETGRRQAEENARKTNYYLFRRFGPIELP